MQSNETLTEESLEAATDNIIKEYKEGKFMHSQIICANGDDAHKAFRSFRRKLLVNPLPQDIIIDCSEDKLREIQNDPKYESLRNTGVDEVFSLAVAAAAYDNAEKLKISSEAISRFFSGEGKGIPGTSHEFLTKVIKRTKNTRALVIYDDFVNTIQYAEASGLNGGPLPFRIGRNFWESELSHDNFSMLGFTRPDEQTRPSLKREHIVGEFHNNIAQLQHKPIQSYLQ